MIVYFRFDGLWFEVLDESHTGGGQESCPSQTSLEASREGLSCHWFSEQIKFYKRLDEHLLCVQGGTQPCGNKSLALVLIPGDLWSLAGWPPWEARMSLGIASAESWGLPFGSSAIAFPHLQPRRFPGASERKQGACVCFLPHPGLFLWDFGAPMGFSSLALLGEGMVCLAASYKWPAYTRED